MARSTRFSTRALTRCALFTALLAVCSQLAVPIGPVPINLALLAVELCGALLAPDAAALSVLAYLLLGAAGLPVFAGFRGGPQALLGPTGGYLAGYLPAAALISALKGRDESGRVRLALAMAAGCALCYALGTAWFCHASGRSVREALGLCVWPFLPGDAAKIALAVLLAPRLRRFIR